MYKKAKKILISLIILSIIIIILLVVLLKKYTQKDTSVEYDISKDQLGDLEEILYEKQSLNNATVFYTIEKCLNEYLDFCIENNVNSIMNVLDKEYIEGCSISDTNVFDFVNRVNQNEQIILNKVYEQKNNYIYTYIVKGILTNSLKEVYFVVKFDDIDLTYSIIPLLEQKYNNFEAINYENKIQKIEQNVDNQYTYYRIKETELVKKYFQYYKLLLKYNKNEAFELLDNEYKNKKFKSLLESEKYLNDNEYINSELTKYAKYTYDNYTQYVCIDNSNNYFIVNETATMEFKVLLDTYTINQPEFIEKYEKADNKEKAGYNINKFISAINSKDYNYAYNCLADSFKANNFTTVSSFENYVKRTFFENNKIEYLNCSVEGGYYVYKVNITDNNFKSIQKNFIVNLKDNMEFEMSFNIN